MSVDIYPVAFNLKQAAQYLGIGVETFKQGVRSGQIKVPVKRVNERYIVPKKALDEWLSVGDNPKTVWRQF
jgi:excisionase family DNA binding protein